MKLLKEWKQFVIQEADIERLEKLADLGDDLFERPQQAYTQQLLQSIPGRSLLQ